MKFAFLAVLHLALQPTIVAGKDPVCHDEKGMHGQNWHDDMGEEYDCEWYGDYWNRCDEEGGTTGANGLTANQACCACGGGNDEKFDFVPNGYTFHSQLDSHGYDILQADLQVQTIQEIASACSRMTECLAFNRNGWMKYKLDDFSRWVDIGCFAEPCEQGMYVEDDHFPVSIGRPFVDKSGKHLSASADVQDTASWSADCPVDIDVQRNNNTDTAMKALGTDWTRRALGEHASIASFAAFTVALMSNQAPPKFIADSLVAASDEYRHAQTSFEIASLLLGESVEPQAIPPSSHDFGYNLAALALGTAEEGCIGETLSAIVSAYEVDYEINEYDGINDDVKALLKDKVETIVLEESRHAMLAWRTVAWVCSTDEKACEEVLRTKFTQKRLDAALQSHLAGEGKEKARSEGEKIFKALVPYVVNKKNDDMIDCGRFTNVEGFDSGKPMVEQLSDMIIHGVICS